jgi:spore coat polysaccharide biosynthesis protein SpsF (cytidylyltransferase family)
MTQAELVTAIGNTLTRMDNTLMDPDLQNQPARWQQVYAMRKHLDDQQRELVAATIQADDAAFQNLTGKIQLAIKQLQQIVDNLKKIDSIINTIARISAVLDEILKAAA